MNKYAGLLFTLTLIFAQGLRSAPAAFPNRAFEDASNVLARSRHPLLEAVGGFAAGQSSLAVQFSGICGDTFCAGDFSNLQALSLNCSVASQTSQVGQCLWVFAGSYATVEASSGRVNVHQRVIECDLGFAGSASELGNFLASAADGGASGDLGLRKVKIPGNGRTLMEVLVKCL